MRKNTKDTVSRRWLLIFLVLLMCSIAGGESVGVQAASLKKMEVKNGGFKSGKYYFKINSTGQVMMAASKNGKYRSTPIRTAAGFAANGKEVYYIITKNGWNTLTNYLYKYVFASRKSYLVATLPSSGPEVGGAILSEVDGNNLFIEPSADCYIYNVKTKKLKLARAKCRIVDRYKKYVVSEGEVLTEAAPCSITLYKIKGSKLEKIKKLATYGMSPTFAGGYLYYAVFSGRTNPSFTLYRCRPNGKGAKKIYSVKASHNTFTTKITSKYFEFIKDTKEYRYTYAAKKLQRL